jgi:hypothetical protein
VKKVFHKGQNKKLHHVTPIRVRMETFFICHLPIGNSDLNETKWCNLFPPKGNLILFYGRNASCLRYGNFT